VVFAAALTFGEELVTAKIAKKIREGREVCFAPPPVPLKLENKLPGFRTVSFANFKEVLCELCG
jgi:hypothetical protein